MDDLTLLTRPAVELAARIRARELSPVELTEASLRQIERVDDRLNAFVTLDPEGALAAARAAADRVTGGAGPLPPFLGVPIAIKDLHLTEGMRTTFGTKSLASFVPTFDEENVARLRRAGFVFVGKTNVPEFGTVPFSESELLGPCRNPWDPTRTPGGSSGGAAAAVAAGMVPVAQASDGGGSIRIPASNCGLFGLKPARGRISGAPLFGDQLGGLSTSGTITRHVVDAAATLDLMAGYVAGDPHFPPPPRRPFVDEVGEDPPPLRVGLVTTTPLSTFDTSCLTAVEDAAALLEDLGHTIEPLTLPLKERFRGEFEILWSAGVAALPVDPATLEPFNAALAERGRATSAGRLLQAVTSLQQQSRAIVAACLDFDVVVSPTLCRPPLEIGEFAGLDIERMFDANVAYVGLTPVANVTGQPSMNLPLGWSPGGHPVGVMVTGRPADEAGLLRLAGQVQRAVDWSAHRPPLSDFAAPPTT